MFSQEIIFKCCDYNRYSDNLQPIFMKTNRLLKHKISDLKPLYLFISSVLLAVIFAFIPPSNPLVVICVVAIATSIVYTTTSFLKRPKLTIIFTSFTLLFLVITYLVGFDIMNTILLLSFIIALSQLIPTKIKSV